MKANLCIACLGVALVGLPAAALAQDYNHDNPQPVNGPMSDRVVHQDHHFLTHAAEGSTNEIALSRLAEHRAQDPQVREFAKRMIHDHEDLNSRVKMLAQRRGVDLSEAMRKGWHDNVDSLARKSGADFDQEYLSDMIKGHKDTIDLFEDTAQNSRDPEVASMAADALPTILSHYRHARHLAHQEDDNGATNGNYPNVPPQP